MDCSNGYMFFCTIYIIAIQKPANSIKLISCQKRLLLILD
ncbi:hypothetical protein BACSTE_02966 [Bacteroides stercoris ATCC 43183]|uniref:Uncharacterized protein n=1 Tax=Bacteroides stercoris ATCC 43183 TaxID=449673 RepID=B0NTY1_BACSE|nr:hypothetical protein BACSTE_02966 [Bacteroides stercoris ATCC 43183]